MCPMNSKKIKRLAPLAITALAATGWIGSQAVDGSSDSSNRSSQPQDQGGNDEAGVGKDSCTYDSLPVEAQDQIEDILVGAEPDDGAADGKHFGNYEGLLPKEKSSYYREYTVKTPGLNHRGERRLVVGGGSETDPDVWYYTSDHFESFCSIPDAEG